MTLSLSEVFATARTRADVDVTDPANKFLLQALEDDKRQTQRLAVQARWAALAVIAAFLPFLNTSWDVLYYEVLLLGFAVIGWAQLRVAQVGLSRTELLLMYCDVALMAFILVVPNPFVDYPWPLAMQYHFGGFIYYFIFLAYASLAYSWRTLFAFGTWTSVTWIVLAVIIWFMPVRYPELTAAVKGALAGHPVLFSFLDPNDVALPKRIQEVLVLLIVTLTLAVGGWRTRQLLVRQAGAARERNNLARHFPPSIVDQLAERDQPLGQVRSQPVAVMFVDIVGFTQFAARHTPDEVVAFLRDFHRRMEQAVFQHHGTLDKFLGDGLMATFGTPEPGPEDALNALNCARDMVHVMDEWNRSREKAGEEAIRLSVGVHYGDVVLGDVGSERRLEFAVLGDAVNVASHLEALTRSLGVHTVISDDLVRAVNGEGAESGGATAQEALNGFHCGERHKLKGRDESVLVWTDGADVTGPAP